MKKKIIIIAAVFILTSAIIMTKITKKTEMSITEPERTIIAVSKAVGELGYEFSSLEKLFEPIVYSYDGGNEIIYYQFYCSDPERIKDGEVSFYKDIFDPKEADNVQNTYVNKAQALLCDKDGRSYLIWYPNEKTILMIDYDPDAVSDTEILKMAESCE